MAADWTTAVGRFGLGSTGRPSKHVGTGRDYLLSQLNAEPKPDAPWSLPSGIDMFVARRAAIASGAKVEPGKKRPYLMPGDVLLEHLSARIERAISTPTPLVERLALHWINHFTVSAASGFTGFFAADFDRDVIRKHMLGRFEALLIAATLHPAMLLYLDNAASFGPGSARGVRSKGRRGLNENLAREVLELHTLGVDGGYSQAEVTELARALTGWTVRGDPAPMPAAERIAFAPEMHEPGARTVLGKRYAEDGAGQSLAILRDLARHPATARHVARRMVDHFIGQTAPPALVDMLARTYLDSDGNLKSVTRALIESDVAWTLPAAKIRPPIEMVLCTARLLGAPPQPPRPIQALVAMGQPYLSPAGPNGWSEADNGWAAPDALKTRLDWAAQLSARWPVAVEPATLLQQAFGDDVSAETRATVLGGATFAQSLTLLLLSPEFQRR